MYKTLQFDYKILVDGQKVKIIFKNSTLIDKIRHKSKLTVRSK
jgi:hypothetical protein